MKLKNIALLVVAMLLVVGSAAGIALAGAEERSGNYWWEDPSLDCLIPYERRQVKEIITHIMNRYFGIDVSLMSFEEMDEVGRSIGPEGGDKFARLFEHYAARRGFEIPPPCEQVPAPQQIYPPGLEPYWWEAMNAEKAEKQLMQAIARAKGMCPDEVRERFSELFPGVDLWTMTLTEYMLFIEDLPRPPRRLPCIEEARRDPYVVAFGIVPALSSQAEIDELDYELRKVFRAACLDRYPVGLMFASGGIIHIGLVVFEGDAPPPDVPPVREIHGDIVYEMYEIISEKAESLLDVQDVAVIFMPSGRMQLAGLRPGPTGAQTQSAVVSAECPWWAWNRPIIGGIGKTIEHGYTSTTGFAIRRFTWWRPWDWWDEDYEKGGQPLT